jgi:hypothetical protein
MPTYLELAYEGNYVGHLSGIFRAMEVFTYQGKVYVANPETDKVLLY